MKCPICKRRLRRTDPEVPFCSERCRRIDLGNWASGKYRVPSPLPDTEESAPEAGSDQTSEQESQ